MANLLFPSKQRRITKKSSVLFFTVHKAASTYVDKVLFQISHAARFNHLPLNEKSEIELSGNYYGPSRRFFPIDDSIDACRVILQLRDPRDVLVSYFFSLKFSHVLPEGEQKRDDFIKLRESMESVSIDEFVIEQAPSFLATYESYFENFIGRENVLLVHYEDMVTDFEPWLHKITRFLRWNWSYRVIKETNKQVRESSFEVSGESVNDHKRQVTPGDHSRKLRADTIDELNRIFQPIFESIYKQPKLQPDYNIFES